MDIDYVDNDDNSILYTVLLTKEDVAAYTNAVEVLKRATTCAETLLGLAIVALEMQAKQGDFQLALREATESKSAARAKMEAIHSRPGYVWCPTCKMYFGPGSMHTENFLAHHPQEITRTNPTGQERRRLTRRVDRISWPLERRAGKIQGGDIERRSEP